MAIKKAENGWIVDIQPNGRGGKRYRKTLKTQAEAKQWEAWIKTKVTQNPDWQPEKKDTRRMLELAKLWYDNHAKELRAGENTYSRVKLALEAMGNPIASSFKETTFTEYRAKRLEAGIALNTVNREHAYLRAMINELIALKIWKGANPLEAIRQFKIQENELRYLQEDEIKRLLAQLARSSNRHVLLVSKICLATGARWSEAENLRTSQIMNGRIQFARTKTNKARAVPLDKSLVKEIAAHERPDPKSPKLFEYCLGAFREAIERAEIELPKGQMTHILRHSFASHFMINGGNIIVLQRILGHVNLTTTMRYAHLAPTHLEEAKRLNPLARLTLG